MITMVTITASPLREGFEFLVSENVDPSIESENDARANYANRSKHDKVFESEYAMKHAAQDTEVLALFISPSWNGTIMRFIAKHPQGEHTNRDGETPNEKHYRREGLAKIIDQAYVEKRMEDMNVLFDGHRCEC
jgi:hypothetical protein